MTTRQTQARFDALVNEHKGIIYKICQSYGWNDADREDLAQDIIVQLWRSFARFDERQRFSTWMYRVALNVAISFCRRESVRSRHVISTDEHVLAAAEDVKGQPEEIGLLYQFIGKLEELNRALVLLYLDGNSYKEIACVLGISETNVATRVNRLKNSMRQQFNRNVQRT